MISSTPATDDLTTDSGDEFVTHVLPKTLQKNYYIYRIFLNQSQPIVRPHPSNDPLGNTINIVGLLVALLVSVIIIVGVAFVIRKIRKRQGPVDDDNEAGVDQSTKAVSGTFPEMVTVHPSADAVQGDEQTPQVFTITFTAVPKKQKMYIRALPKFLRPKPKQVDIEKIKRELGHVYVY